MHEVCKFDDDSLFLDDLFRDNLATYTPTEGKVESRCEDVHIIHQPLFLDELFKDECDHSGEKTRAKDFKFRVPLRNENLI